MSIFKDTLKPEVIAQLRARQSVISQEDRDGSNNPNGTFVGYQTKNAWVRMTSLVNYDSGKDIIVNEGNFVNIIKDNAYTGDQLSRKYVLFGGTPYYNPSTNKSFLRKGVDKADAIYGSNLDYNTFYNTVNATNQYDRPFGARPMPGISSVQINSKSAYGSLREAIVKFYCWDRHQLEELEILFMRPGYSVILEWGWSKYIDYTDAISKSIENIPNPKTINAKAFTVTNFTTPTINTYDKNLTVDTVYSEIDKITKQAKCNYDALLGYVKNFNWVLLDNGGFECTTTLIALGEVISSLKVSANTSKIGDETNIFANPDQPKPYQYTDYEKILLTLKADSDRADFTSGSYTNVDLQNLDIVKIKTELGQKMTNRGHGDLYNKYLSNSAGNNIQPYLKKSYSTNTSNGEPINEFNEYISFDVWIALMDSYFLLNDSNNNTRYLYFKIPNNFDYCLAAPDSISIDPSVCYVDNVNAFPEVNYIYYRPYTINGNKGVLSKLITKDKTATVSLEDFYNPNKRIGVLKNIYINIDYLLSSFKNMNSSTNDDGVNILDYVQNVLNSISTALGGLNNFKVFTKDNRIIIGDAYYVEDPSEAKINKKFKFDLLGLKSICRDVNITSRIFQEQSTMIAIAAQAKANIGDIYSSSQTIFNAGLTDRLVVAKNIPGSNNSPTSGTPASIKSGEDDLYNKLLLLSSYIKQYVIGEQYAQWSGGAAGPDQYRITNGPNPSASTATLRSILLQFNPEINFKALIPFELEITLDGIGGLVIGQIFTVNKDILPKDYYNKNLGFIITGISHDLSKNDWVTKIKTQICLLDDEADTRGNKINQLSKALNKARIEKVKELVSKYTIKSLNYAILKDFILYQFNKSIASFMYANQPGSSVLGADVYTDGQTSANRTNLTPFVDVSYRYNSLKDVYNSVTGSQAQSVTDYFNGNAGDLVNKPGTVKFYPAKQYNNSSTDIYGYTNFAKDWIASLKTNTTAIASQPFAPEVTSSVGEVISLYETDINNCISSGYLPSFTSLTFDPSLYLNKTKDDLSLLPNNSLITPDDKRLYGVGADNIFTKTSKVIYFGVGDPFALATRRNNIEFVNINYDKLNTNIIKYLDSILTTSPPLMTLKDLWVNINSGARETRTFSNSPVYTGYDLKIQETYYPDIATNNAGRRVSIIANDNPDTPNPTSGIIYVNSEFLNYYQITGGRNGAAGNVNTTEAAARAPYTRHRN